MPWRCSLVHLFYKNYEKIKINYIKKKHPIVHIRWETWASKYLKTEASPIDIVENGHLFSFVNVLSLLCTSRKQSRAKTTVSDYSVCTELFVPKLKTTCCDYSECTELSVPKLKTTCIDFSECTELSVLKLKTTCSDYSVCTILSLGFWPQFQNMFPYI